MVHKFLDSEILQDSDKISMITPTKNDLSIATSEGYHLIGIFKDKHSKELKFPTLFFGHPRIEKIYNNFSYYEIAKWELLYKSHDFAINIQNNFFKATKICIEKVKNSSWIRIRKGKLNGRTLIAVDVAKEPNLDNILQSYTGFRDLKRLYTSPDYIEGLRKNLFAMIRQLCPPTFFITLTGVERLWTPLIQALFKLNVKHLNLPDFNSLEFIHIAELIRFDLVTCALYYNNRTAAFQKLIKKESSIIGEVVDIFFIKEFHHRGNEHEHAVIWL